MAVREFASHPGIHSLQPINITSTRHITTNTHMLRRLVETGNSGMLGQLGTREGNDMERQTYMRTMTVTAICSLPHAVKQHCLLMIRHTIFFPNQRLNFAIFLLL
jgi:hypothetical protein